MQLDLDKGKIEREVILGGKTYKVAPLKVKDQLAMIRELQAIPEGSVEYMEASIKHIARCGIEQEVLEDLEAGQLTKLTEFLSSEKKL